jgi:hypothetical protein
MPSRGVSDPVPHGVVDSSLSLPYPVDEYMPNSVDDVRLRIDLVRLKLGVSTPEFGFGSRRFGLDSGVGGDGVSGGVALVRLRSKGRLGVGRKRGGPSEAILSYSVLKSSVSNRLFVDNLRAGCSTGSYRL